jgi:hypothetical protein
LALLGNGRTTCRASTKEERDLLAEIDRRVHVHVAYFQHGTATGDRGSIGVSTQQPTGLTTEQPTGLTKEQYIASADAICGPFNRRFNRLQGRTNQSLTLPPSPATDQPAAQLLDQTAALLGDQVAALERVEPPPDDAATVQKFLDALTEQQRLTGEQSLAVSSGDYETGAVLRDQLDEAQARSIGIAQGYGFHVCA